mmetsp:Transcript_44076/g.70772  ORF Transcript_44076/g.70772 Transcript_44076/m.70772 type:complete len:203 (-) Transcript_44076:350-958(-)
MPSPAFAADPTPDVESSTAMQFFGSAFVFSAASTYTAGSGLKRGGSKSLSPEWIISGGKKASNPQEMTDTGTRGLPLVVAIEKGTPIVRSVSRTSGTCAHGLASTDSASTVSSFCSVSKSTFSARVSASRGSPNSVRRASTCVTTSGSSPPPVRTASTSGSPAAFRSASTTSTMNSKALPALFRTYASMVLVLRYSTDASGK